MDAIVITEHETIHLKQGETVSSKLYEQEQERIKKLPHWAQTLINQQHRDIESLENDIKERDFDTENTGKVSFRVFGTRDKVDLRDDASVRFTLKDSIIKGSTKNYRHRHALEVKIVDDVETGGEMIELYYSGDDKMVIVHHTGNMFHLRPNDVSRRDFVGFKPHNEEFTDEDRNKGRDDA